MLPPLDKEVPVDPEPEEEVPEEEELFNYPLPIEPPKKEPLYLSKELKKPYELFE